MKTLLFIVFLVALVALASTLLNTSPYDSKRSSSNTLHTNEEYIENINRQNDLSDTMRVFTEVFHALKSEVSVYPTENYYYYQFETSGRTIKGNIALFADRRDSGKANFSYEETSALPGETIGLNKGNLELDMKKGVQIDRIDDFTYDMTYQGKTVRFHLNKLNMYPPQNLHLRPNEALVGTSQDESGLKFHLVFDTTRKHLFWLLDEDQYTPESFADVTEHVIVGKRTEFVFYSDEQYNRKVLFGVKAENVKMNNWFDGPFDQLPDNFIKNGKIKMQWYIEQAYPGYKGKINKYGHFLNENGMRVAISSYLVYNSLSDVGKVYYACKNSCKSKEEFTFQLTQERWLDKSTETSDN